MNINFGGSIGFMAIRNDNGGIGGNVAISGGRSNDGDERIGSNRNISHWQCEDWCGDQLIASHHPIINHLQQGSHEVISMSGGG